MRAWPLFLILAVTPVSAQELVKPEPRQGYYIGGGYGLGVVKQSSPDRALAGMGGSFGAFRVGDMVNDWLGLGLQFGGGGGADEVWQGGYGAFMLDVQVVPWRRLSLQVQAGVGGSGLALVEKRPGDEDLGTGGGFFGFGASYDFFPFHDEGESGGFALAPTLRVYHAPGNELATTVVTVGFDTLFWLGLDRDKLDLPPDQSYGPR